MADNGRETYIRNFIFGVEDGLVSTVGLLSGVAAAGTARPTIILTGIVLILVEAFSMAVGSFLSEKFVEEYERQSPVMSRQSFAGGVTMFFSYLLSGFIPLAPYIVLTVPRAFPLSIAASFAALFFLGVVGGRIARVNMWRRGARMLIIGGSAIFLGTMAGLLLKKYNI